ncbi:Alpha/Beta hydrolase protein [Russula compacta]|nr:Alpha/Beta hydrolase protein [Russula compacta]
MRRVARRVDGLEALAMARHHWRWRWDEAHGHVGGVVETCQLQHIYQYHKENGQPPLNLNPIKQQRSTMTTALERSLTEAFPNILELPSGLKLQVSLTPPGPVTEMDEERGVAALPGKRLAICLHPWARLGGNMDDPVLKALLRPLTHYLKFYVLRYNARGVGLSSGWKSFTGLQEVEDLRELVNYALKRLSDVREVALIGYSNGGLTASLHPLLPPPLRTSHVLISYPLGPRALLTAFRTRTYQRGLEDLVRQPGARVLLCQGDADDFTGAEAYDEWAEALGQLAAAGDDVGEEGTRGDEEGRQDAGGGEDEDGEDDDEGGRGRASAERGGSGLEVVRIPGASHFWGGEASRGLIESVTQFLT